MNDKDVKKLLADVDDIKKLLILQLFGQGFRQKQIAQMMGISEPTMSRMIPKGLSKSGNKRSSPSIPQAEDLTDG